MHLTNADHMLQFGKSSFVPRIHSTALLSLPTVAIKQTAQGVIISTYNWCSAIQTASRGDLVSIRQRFVICTNRDEGMKLHILNGNIPRISI